MSQQEIAKKTGISQQMVSSITAKVGITSFNLHFIFRNIEHKMRFSRSLLLAR